MRKKLMIPAFVFAALLIITTVHAGGWAVISVEEFPDHVTATKPFALTFRILQHGVNPMSGLSPVVVARAGTREVSFIASGLNEKGRYLATLSLPEARDWTITIKSGFGGSNLTLPAVSATGKPAAAVSAGERGRRLFVARGCIGCHSHALISPQAIYPVGGKHSSVGGDLTEKRFTPEYLNRLLTDPASVLERRDYRRMPALDLRSGEIAALIAFINGINDRAAR